MQQQAPQSPPVLNVKDNNGGMEMPSFNQYHHLVSGNNESPFAYHPEPLLPSTSAALSAFSNGNNSLISFNSIPLTFLYDYDDRNQTFNILVYQTNKTLGIWLI